MEENFSKAARRAMAILAIIYGLFGAYVVPVLAGITFNRLVQKLLRLMVEDPHYNLAPKMLTIWFTGMLGITFVASIILIATAYPLWKGKSWAWPVALSCISLPTIFAVIEILPYVVHMGKPPLTMISLLVGLAVYLTFVLLRKGKGIEKAARFVVFTLLGVVAGHINVLTMHGFKGVLDWPQSPLFSALQEAIYAVEAPANFIAMGLCIIAIPLLAAGKKRGWWLALFAGSVVIAVNYPTHFIRMVTSDFFMAGTLGLALVVSLIVPPFRKALLGEAAPQT
jgi:hypothetical protein